MDNYRPISVLPVISKLLEREVHNQLIKYLREHKILSPYQYGFRKLHSTEFATLAFADTIRRNIDNGLMTGAVFLDFKKAFDSVDHSLLLDKLYNLGILDREHEWFANYLNGRKQIVDYHGMLSATKSVNVGVPQGSILGPFLFVLHVNDLPNATCHCSVLMYADDTVLFCSGRDASAIENKLNNEVSLLGTWLRDKRLFLNTVKTESMLIGIQAKVSKVINFNIMWNGILIKRVYQFKYLGVTFDEHLSWNMHIGELVSKTSKKLGMLRRMRGSLTVYSANAVYISFSRPIMEYCDTVWNCCGVCNSTLLEKLQRRAARIITKERRSDDAMKAIKWPMLEDRRWNHTHELVKKCVAGYCPQYFKNYFTFNHQIYDRVTRQKDKLHLPKVRTEIEKHSFYYTGCLAYNKAIS